MRAAWNEGSGVPKTTSIVGLLLVLGFVFLTIRDLQGRAVLRERAEIAEVRADSIHAVALFYQEKLEAIRAIEDALITDLVEQRDSALARAGKASRVREVVVDRIIEVAGDSAAVVEAVADLQAIHTAEIHGRDSAIALGDSIIAAQYRTIRAYEAANATLLAALSASRAEAQTWERAAKPGLFSKSNVITGGVLVIAAALVVLR